MAATQVLRTAGPTTAIAVTTASSTAVTITPAGTTQVSYCGFLNVASTPIAITITPVVDGVGTAVAAAFPTAGSSNNTIVLGVSMSTPMVIAVPPIFQVTAIGTASSTLYVTPMVDQT